MFPLLHAYGGIITVMCVACRNMVQGFVLFLKFVKSSYMDTSFCCSPVLIVGDDKASDNVRVSYFSQDVSKLSQLGTFGINASVRLLNRSCLKLWTSSDNVWVDTFK